MKNLKIITEDSYLKAYDENNVLVGYQPKNNAPELDLPLLPDMVVEDDVESIIDSLLIERGEHPTRVRNAIYGEERKLAKDTYKTATKTFSEKDLIKAMDYGRYNMKHHTEVGHNDFIQYLKKSKTPKWFVAGTVTMNKGYTDKKDYPYQECEVLKTTTINGKTYLVGKYLFE